VFAYEGLTDVDTVLRARYEHGQAVARTGRIIQHVFLGPRGEPIGTIRGAWRRAALEAGVPWLRPHDLRRTAAREMVTAGIPERVVMELLGHQTRAMLDRYHVVALADQREAVRRLAAHRARPFTLEPAQSPAQSNAGPLATCDSESPELAAAVGEETGAGDRNRTGDPFITSEVLYQLSYTSAMGMQRWIRLAARARHGRPHAPKNGATPQNRTGDTVIFSHVLYQLS